MKIAMLGTGAYGLALASKLAGNGHKVVMWTENKDKEKEEVEELVDKTKKALEGEDTDEIKKTSEELSNKVMEVSSRIYQEQAAESQKQSENASHEEESEEKESKKDNVKDAEFEEK